MEESLLAQIADLEENLLSAIKERFFILKTSVILYRILLKQSCKIAYHYHLLYSTTRFAKLNLEGIAIENRGLENPLNNFAVLVRYTLTVVLLLSLST